MPESPRVLLRGKQTAGGDGPPLHQYHFDEAFYILEGEVTFLVRGELSTARPASSRSHHAAYRTATSVSERAGRAQRPRPTHG